MIAAASTTFVPAEIRSYVGAFVWRRRWVALLRAVGWAIAFAVAWLSLCCVADRILALDRVVRSALLAANILGILALLWPAVARMFRKRIDWTAAAAQIEGRGEKFAQRLVTITSQMQSEPAQRGSEQMLAAIGEALRADLRRGDAAALAPLRAATGAWITAVGMILLFLLAAEISWLAMPQLLARALEPWVTRPAVTTTTLWIQPGDARIRQGSDLTISVRAARLGDEPPTLWISSDDGRTWQGQPMAAAQAGFALTLGDVQRDLQYFVRGGDARSDGFTVRVLRPPQVMQFRVRYVYPAYTAKPPLTVTNADGLIEAPVGSSATVEIVCTAPLTAATLTVGDQPIATSPTSQPNVRQCTLHVERDAKLQLELIGEEISGAGPATMAIHALPDMPPVVNFIEPAGDLRLGPRDTLPVTCLATDDYGVTSAALHVQLNLAVPVQIAIPLSGQPRYRRGTIALDLAQFDLTAGDLIRLSLVATDNGGHEQIGDEQRFILISAHGVDPAARMCLGDLQRAAAVSDALAGDIETAGKSLQEARQRAGGDVRDADALAPTRQNLASAANAAAMLRPLMLAAIAHCDSPALATGLCRWVDTAAVLAGAVDRTSARLATGVQSDLPGGLEQVAALARQLHQDLNTVAQGQLAAALRTQSTEPAHAPAFDALAKVSHRLDQQLHDDAARLGLDPAAGDFSDRLAALIDRESELLARQHPFDYAQAADSWARHMQQGHAPDSDMAARLDLGAQAESLRPDSNLVRANDLHLASAAAPAMVSGPMATQRDQFAPALAAMQRDEQDTPRSDQIRAEADAAREKMIAWARIVATSRPEMNTMDQAMQSNAQMGRHDYAAAAKTDQAVAQLSATRPAASVQQEMAAAQSIDQIRREQDDLLARTAAAPAEQDAQLAVQQAAIARAIARQDGSTDRADRTAGIAAIHSATTRLSELAAQLPQALSAAAGHRQAAQQTAAASRTAAAATQPANQAIAAAALRQARANQDQADQRQAAAARAVDPALARAITQSLSKSSSSSDAAAATIDRKLTPALAQLRQAMDGSDAAGTDRAAALAAAAVAVAQDQLAAAKSAAMRGDPLASAQYFADSAAQGLSGGGNRGAVASDQRDASAALAQAWQQAAHAAAMGRLAHIPSVAAILNPLNPNLTDQSGGGSATAWSVDAQPAMRQWGQMQNRPPGGISAPMNQSDPAGYEESLKAYFEALNRSDSAADKP